jgi:hypothetical protein
VRDASGTIVAVGTLGPGGMIPAPRDMRGCGFPLLIPDVPVMAFYMLDIGGTEQVAVTREQMFVAEGLVLTTGDPVCLSDSGWPQSCN